MGKSMDRELVKKVETANSARETTDNEMPAVFNGFEPFQALTSNRTLAIKEVMTTRESARFSFDASPKSPKALVKHLV